MEVEVAAVAPAEVEMEGWVSLEMEGAEQAEGEDSPGRHRHCD